MAAAAAPLSFVFDGGQTRLTPFTRPCFACAVCGSSERAAAARLHLVRRSSGLPAQKHGPTEPGSGPHWPTLSILFHPVHSGAALEGGQDAAQAVHQIHLPLGVLLFLPL